MTSRALADLGWPATVEAPRHDISGMVETLLGETLRSADHRAL
jgi:hypothetical protein